MKAGLTILLVLLLNAGSAQPLFEVFVDKRVVEKGEWIQLTLSFKRTAKGSLIPPGSLNRNFEFKDLEPYKEAHSQRIYHSYLIRPKKEGTTTIDAIQFKAEDGAIYSSDPIEIRSGAQAIPFNFPKSEARVVLSKAKVYEGEVFLATSALVHRFKDFRFDPPKLPTTNGFLGFDLDKDYQFWNGAKVRAWNGYRGEYYLLKRELLIPQQSGTIEIAGLEVKGIVNSRYDAWGRLLSKGKTHHIKATPITIEVLPLPDNAPSSFDGAVGQFDLSVQMEQRTFKANEVVRLLVHVEGKGNLKLIPAPQLNFPEGFEVYDPRVNERIKASSNGFSGIKTFEYLLIPKQEGQFTIDAFNFSYFDPEVEQYKTITSAPLPLTIVPGDGQPLSLPEDVQQEAALTPTELLPPKQLNTPQQSIGLEFGSWAHWLGTSTPPLFLLFILLVMKRKRSAQPQENQTLSLAIDSIIERQLQKATRHLKEGTEGFHEALMVAVEGYLLDKTGLNTAQLTRTNIEQALASKGVSEQQIASLTSIMDQCEMARFTPGDTKGSEQLLQTTKTALKELEATLS